MKKLLLSLILALNFLSFTMTAHAEETPEGISVRVVAEFEETDYQGHAQEPEEISFAIIKYPNTWPGTEDSYVLKRENNYSKEFNNLVRDLYEFRLKDIYSSPIYRYYEAKPDIVRVDDSQEVTFKFIKKRTNIYLELEPGDLVNHFDQTCSHGGGLNRQTLSFIANEDEIKTDDLSGAVFELLDDNNNIIHTASTDSEGKLAFRNILYGNYKVRQVSAPKGFEVNDSLLDIDVHIESNAGSCLGTIYWYNELKKDEPIVDEPGESEDPGVDEPIVDEPGESEDTGVDDPIVEEPSVDVPDESEGSNIDKPVADIPEESETPEIDNSENTTVPEDLGVVSEEPTKSVVSENNESKINDVNEKESLKAPNTGITSSYAPYILVILLGLLSVVSRSYYKMKKINKRQ